MLSSRHNGARVYVMTKERILSVHASARHSASSDRMTALFSHPLNEYLRQAAAEHAVAADRFALKIVCILTVSAALAAPERQGVRWPPVSNLHSDSGLPTKRCNQ